MGGGWRCGRMFFSRTFASTLNNLTAPLRRIVLFGDPTLRWRFNLGCISLGAVGGADDFVVSLFRFDNAS